MAALKELLDALRVALDEQDMYLMQQTERIKSLRAQLESEIAVASDAERVELGYVK